MISVDFRHHVYLLFKSDVFPRTTPRFHIKNRRDRRHLRQVLPHHVSEAILRTALTRTPRGHVNRNSNQTRRTLRVSYTRAVWTSVRAGLA